MTPIPANSSSGCRYFFDFIKSFVPQDPIEIFRAMFDLPSPYADGSQKFDYAVGAGVDRGRRSTSRISSTSC